MVERNIICDRCGRKMLPSRTFPKKILNKRVGRIKKTTRHSEDVYDYIEEDLDLCEKCISEFEKWVKNENDQCKRPDRPIPHRNLREMRQNGCT